MTLEQVKQSLQTAQTVNFKLPTGAYVPEHFHVTEVGLVTKSFIDCGGTTRTEKVVNFQLWNAHDTDHRLKPQKLLNIISLSQQKLGIGNYDVEVEYQTDTIGKYSLHYNGKDFLLTPKQTACLASDACGVESYQQTKEISNTKACCKPGSGCC
jgi:hypothetical protein